MEALLNDPTALAHWIESSLQGLGPWGPLALGGAALIEYVFPPFPGDTVTLVGGVLARGDLSRLAWVILALGLGNMAGILLDWSVGRRLGRVQSALPREAARRWWQPLSQERFETFSKTYARWGDWLLVANRFLPAARAFFFLAAGAAGFSLRRTLVLGLLSALLWNFLILGLGALLGANLEELLGLAARISWVGASLGALILMGLWLGWQARRRARHHRDER